MSLPVAALLQVDDALLAVHSEVYGPDATTRGIALAEALTASPAWARLRRDAHMAVRPDTGLIGVLGRIDADAKPLLDALGWQVDDLLHRLRPVPYRAVEEACFDLAARVRAELSDEELSGCQLVPLPRGGMIVGGLLAYELRLARDQVMTEPATGGVTVLADDCALSGTRVREWLRAHPGRDVIVAHLHAHPELSRRIAEEEPSVRACVAARELVDHGPRRPDYDAWTARWTERSPTDYWIGDPDHVAYPWNEPDVRVWNETTGRAEGGWRVVPPHWCLKNRSEMPRADLQRCPAAPGPLRPADDVLWAEFEDELLVAKRDQPAAVTLRATAADMWRAIVALGEARAVAELISGSYGVDLTTVRSDLDAFIAMLDQRRLLRRTGAAVT